MPAFLFFILFTNMKDVLARACLLNFLGCFYINKFFLAAAAILSVIVPMTGIQELILPMTMELRFMPARLALLKRLAGCPVMAVM